MSGLSQPPCIPIKDAAVPRNTYRDAHTITCPIPAPPQASPFRSIGYARGLPTLLEPGRRTSTASGMEIGENSISAKSSVSRATSIRFIELLDESAAEGGANSARLAAPNTEPTTARSNSITSGRSRTYSMTYVSPTSADESSGNRRPSSLSFQRGKVVGSGGFGTVYQAILSDGSLAAVKEMKLETNAKTIDREVRALSGLPAHPHCVRYLGSRHSRHHYYIIMEYISGGSIQSLRSSVGKFRESVMQRYAKMVLFGLQHLHGHGIIHRDIKGANVLLDEKGSAKIVDFGCCKDLNQPNSTLGGGGTPLWMAPEVCRGEAASEKSDVWSVGCLCLEMTNKDGLPWTFPASVNMQGIAYAIASAKNAPKIPSHLSEYARSFIRSCLQVDPKERLTVNQLLQHPFFLQDYTALDSEDDELVFSREASIDVAYPSHSWPRKVNGNNSGNSNIKNGSSAKGISSDAKKNQYVSVNQGFRLEAASDEDDDDEDDENNNSNEDACTSKVVITQGEPTATDERTTLPWMYRGGPESDEDTSDTVMLGESSPKSPLTETTSPSYWQRQQQQKQQQKHQKPKQPTEAAPPVLTFTEHQKPTSKFGALLAEEHRAVEVCSPLMPSHLQGTSSSPREKGNAVTHPLSPESGALPNGPIIWASRGSDSVLTGIQSQKSGNQGQSPHSVHSSPRKGDGDDILSWLQ